MDEDDEDDDDDDQDDEGEESNEVADETTMDLVHLEQDSLFYVFQNCFSVLGCGMYGWVYGVKLCMHQQ